MSDPSQHQPSAGLVQALAAVEGVASLLACVDPVKWDSLGRPAPQALAALIRGAHANLEAELSAHYDLPSAEA